MSLCIFFLYMKLMVILFFILFGEFSFILKWQWILLLWWSFMRFYKVLEDVIFSPTLFPMLPMLKFVFKLCISWNIDLFCWSILSFLHNSTLLFRTLLFCLIIKYFSSPQYFINSLSIMILTYSAVNSLNIVYTLTQDT